MSQVWTQIAAFAAGVVLGVVCVTIVAAIRERRRRRRQEYMLVRPREMDGLEMYDNTPTRQLSQAEIEHILAFKPVRETPKP